MNGELERKLASGDAAEAKRALDALLVAEERFRLVMENVQDFAIFLTDTRGYVVDWNHGTERLFGYQADEILGEPFTRFFTAEDREVHRPQKELEAAAAAGRAGDENWLVRKDGSRFWASGVTTALRDENGALKGFVKICRDLTGLKALTDALARQSEQLAEANRRKDEFLALLAHELRNPLAPIRNALHILHLRGEDPEVSAWARDVALRQMQHLTRLVDDLLDISRINRGKILLHRERIDLARVVRQTTDDLQSTMAAAQLTLEVEVPDVPVWVEADPTRLAQVLGKLLNNAAKFTDPGGKVAVRLLLSEDRQWAVVTVRDTGIGIDPALLARLFEAFTQGDHSLERSRGGLGLGLALVKALTALHGGTVSASSAGTGQGSEFTLSLPLAPVRDAQPEPARTEPAATRSLRILLVEDNQDAAETLRMLLQLEGHQVRIAHSGPQAVETARQWRPEVVLCDVGLPGMDGNAVARTLRQDPSTAGARLIALSGYGSEDDLQRGRDAGFDLYLVKPVEGDQLQQALADCNQEASRRNPES